MFEAQDEAARDAKVDQFMSSFDIDRDGKIQKAEWLDFFAKLFDAQTREGLIKPVVQTKLSLNENQESSYKVGKKKELIESYLEQQHQVQANQAAKQTALSPNWIRTSEIGTDMVGTLGV